MKRLLFVLLIMTCSVSRADWEYVGKTDTRSEYHDNSTVRRSETNAKMWRLRDYFEMQTNASGKKYKSLKFREVYNCMEDTSAIIALIQYSDSMGRGSVVNSLEVKENQWDWQSVVPGSSGEVFFKIACGEQ